MGYTAKPQNPVVYLKGVSTPFFAEPIQNSSFENVSTIYNSNSKNIWLRLNEYPKKNGFTAVKKTVWFHYLGNSTAEHFNGWIPDAEIVPAAVGFSPTGGEGGNASSSSLLSGGSGPSMLPEAIQNLLIKLKWFLLAFVAYKLVKLFKK